MLNASWNKDKAAFRDDVFFASHPEFNFPAQFARIIPVGAGETDYFIEVKAMKKLNADGPLPVNPHIHSQPAKKAPLSMEF
jgi:hypothetical protein